MALIYIVAAVAGGGTDAGAGADASTKVRSLFYFARLSFILISHIQYSNMHV